MSSTKLRILCLHGFTSNGAVHALQVRRLTSLLPEHDFLFPDGPHKVDIATQMDLNKTNQAWSDLVHSLGPSAGHRAWWFARDSDGYGNYQGLEQSLEYIGKYIHDHGPIHAIWGFSQGGCFAGMLCALFQDQLSHHPFKKHLPPELVVKSPTSAVVFSGFRPRFGQYDSVFEAGIEVPMLHVLGDGDAFVQRERSEALIKVCRTAKLLEHDGGHNIPKKEEDLRQIVEFVRGCTQANHGRTFQASI